MSSEVQAINADAAAWRERTAALGALLRSEQAALTACGIARAAKKRAEEAAQAAGGPSGSRVPAYSGPTWRSPFGQLPTVAGAKAASKPGFSPITGYFPLDISLLAKESINEQFGAPFGEVTGQQGYGVNAARNAEGLPSVSETGAGNQSYAPGGGAAGGGGSAGAPPPSPSGAPDFGSGAPDFGSGAPTFNKPKDLGSGAPDFGSGAPSFGSGATSFGPGAADFGSGAPDFNGGQVGSAPAGTGG